MRALTHAKPHGDPVTGEFSETVFTHRGGGNNVDIESDGDELAVRLTPFMDQPFAHLNHDGVRELRALCDRFLETVEEKGPGRIPAPPSDGPPVPLEHVMSKVDYVNVTTLPAKFEPLKSEVLAGVAPPPGTRFVLGEPMADGRRQVLVETVVFNAKPPPARDLAELVRDDLTLRRMLWLAHGCLGLYGDDGEMHCGACLLDFKREPVSKIERVLAQRGLRALEAAFPDGLVTASEHRGLPTMAGKPGGCQHASCRAHLKIATDALDRMKSDHGLAQIAIAVPARMSTEPDRCEAIGLGPYRCELKAGHAGSCRSHV